MAKNFGIIKNPKRKRKAMSEKHAQHLLKLMADIDLDISGIKERLGMIRCGLKRHKYYDAAQDAFDLETIARELKEKIHEFDRQTE